MSFCTRNNLKANTILSKNSKAPLFELIDSNLSVFSLSEHIGKNNIVLYFYPKDGTPGCTIESKQFSSLYEEFRKLNTIVIGVSKDTAQSHQEFIKDSNLKVLLLSDNNLSVAKQYGSYSKGLLSDINRDTFFINKNGNIEQIWRNVFAIGHAKDVLKYIQEKQS